MQTHAEKPIDLPAPIAAYFALAAFGGMGKRVALLAEFAKDHEAKLLYDLDVDRLGALRVSGMSGDLCRPRETAQWE
jgi:hypothetical protein